MKRLGECNGCGLCCRTLIVPVPHRSAAQRTPIGVRIPLPLFPSPDLLHFYQVRGLRVDSKAVEVPLAADTTVEFVSRGSRLVARMAHTCPQLTTDGRCRIHGSPNFPRACSSFPRTPEDLLEVAEQCSYRFVSDSDVEP